MLKGSLITAVCCVTRYIVTEVYCVTRFCYNCGMLNYQVSRY